MLSIKTARAVEVLRNIQDIDPKGMSRRVVFLVANHVETDAKKTFKAKTNRGSGQGIQSIQVAKIGESSAKVFAGKKYMKIIETGRKKITAKGRKRLYIPLSTKARRKRAGAFIPKSWKWGTDYVLSKTSKAVKPRPFFVPAIQSGRKYAVKLMKEEVKKAIK